ncbi:hypothetical protein [Macrococcoides caseolyticum]|uniref:hypothetical protein n=1 Tax=Macrococcoides caseolyticum TaxID=69966 RepID=UPI001F1F3065|nr:hypothetical protein [Macrococcus caseolyticus]MCE4956059.1 hypothetical protein [Macrococcus caseolyticus]
MKKTIIAALLLSALYSPHVEAKTVNQCNIPGRTYHSISISHPNSLKKIQKGTYAFRGVKLNQTYQAMTNKLGKPETIDIIRDKAGARVFAGYGDYNYIFYSPKRHLKQSALPLKGVTMALNGKQRMLQSELVRILGQSTHKTPVIDEAMIESFNYLHAEYSEISNGFLAESIAMHHAKYTDIIDEYYNSETFVPFTKLTPTALSAKALKAMKQGTYKYKGVKLNDQRSTVIKRLGTSNRDEMTDEYFDDEGYQTLISSYGTNNWVELDYNAPKCDQQFKLTTMSFRYHQVKVPEAKIKEILGRPIDVDTTDYFDDDLGEQVNGRTLYYPNLSIQFAKSGKHYYVDSVTYEKDK